MKTLYEKNIEALKEYKPYLYKKLEEHTENDSKVNHVEFIPTIDGGQTLVVTIAENMYRMNSLYSPIHEAQRWVKQFEFRNLDIVVSMFGLGDGTFVHELLLQLGSGGVLLVYEPSVEVFRYVLENCDMGDVFRNPNVSITIQGVNDFEFTNLLKGKVSWLNVKSQIVTAHPYYETAFEEDATHFYKLIQDNNDHAVVNKNTDVAISTILINNTMQNLKILDRCNLVSDLLGKIADNIPAIIVSAGPSLDKNMDQLRRAKGKAIIFAVDTAVRYLLKEDIIPDFIVTLDPKKSTFHLQDPRCKDIPLFTRFDARSENIVGVNKHIFLYNLEGYIDTVFQRFQLQTSKLRSGGSVATGAFSVCLSLGFKRIILVGQDLAYDGDSTHAGSIHKDITGGASQIEYVEGIDGNLVKTRYDWYVYLRWFEDAIATFEKVHVIDATEGGAKIKGTEIKTLSDSIETYCTKEVNVESILRTIQPIFQDKKKALLDLLKKDYDDFKELKSLAIKAYETSDRLINKYEKSMEETTSSIEKNRLLQQLNQSMEQRTVYELVDWDIAAETADAMGNMYIYTKNEKENRIQTYEHGKRIYKAIENAVDRIEPLFAEGIRYLEEKR